MNILHTEISKIGWQIKNASYKLQRLKQIATPLQKRSNKATCKESPKNYLRLK